MTLGIILFWVLPVLAILWVLWNAYQEYRSDRIPIILYHRFIEQNAAREGRVRDDEMIYVCYDTAFAQQMKYLYEQGYTSLDFEDYLNVRKAPDELPEKPVIITFDDGYLSNYTIAFPELKKYGHKATLFTALEPNEYSYKTVEGVDDFITPEHMREMSNNNVSIQSHTVTHCVLRDLNDETAFYALLEPLNRISKITGRPVRHIAIPRIGYSRRIKKLVKQAGYKTACCNNKGAATGLSDTLALPRIVIERDMEIQDFARALQPKYSLMLRIIGGIKRIPERVGGPTCARLIRNILYKKSLAFVFQTKNLKWLIGAFGLLYVIAVGLFTWWFIMS